MQMRRESRLGSQTRISPSEENRTSESNQLKSFQWHSRGSIPFPGQNTEQADARSDQPEIRPKL
jgi:hypothetical protein